MRYLSIIFVVFLMWYTWSAMEAPAVIPDYTHADVQEDLKRVIQESILEDVPTAQNIQFERIWTETIRSNEMKASFLYSYDDSADIESGTRVGVEGAAILRLAPQSNSENEIWNLEELYILNNRVNFKEGVTVRAN